jgi:hypothetical protein
MTKKRTRHGMRRQLKKLEIPRIEAAILNTLGRDLAQFFEEQRQQTSPDLIDRAAALDVVWEEQNTRP